MAWAFASTGQSNPPLFAALARAVKWHMDDYELQGLANVVWAFATAVQTDEALFAALARVAELRFDEFTS